MKILTDRQMDECLLFDCEFGAVSDRSTRNAACFDPRLEEHWGSMLHDKYSSPNSRDLKVKGMKNPLWPRNEGLQRN